MVKARNSDHDARHGSGQAWPAALVVLALACVHCDGEQDASETPIMRCDGATCPEAGGPPELDASADSGADASQQPGADDGGPATHHPADSSAVHEDGGVASEPSLRTYCNVQPDCDDGLYCNGEEICGPIGEQRKICVPAEHGPCLDRGCDEASDTCDDCSNADHDGDTYVRRGCISGKIFDCDDDDDDHHPGVRAECEAFGREDCDPSNFGSRDVDEDGFPDVDCAAASPFYTLLKQHTTTMDCDDGDREINPWADETCDNVDNNCNGQIDEVYGADEQPHKYYLDADNDFEGSDNPAHAIETLCAQPPPGYVLSGNDCDDREPRVNPNREDVCNGEDDNCNGAIDEPVVPGGQPIDEPFDPGTEYACVNGAWEIVSCPEATDDCNRNHRDACEVSLTTLTDCRKCGQSCFFSCGEEECDEIEQLAAGTHYMCGVTGEGLATCWGRNHQGQLGTDSTRDSSVPRLVVGLPRVEAIAAGDEHTCAIAGTDRALYCWGNNSDGQLGAGTERRSSPAPMPVLGPEADFFRGVVQVAMGRVHSCAVYDLIAGQGGKVACWGQQADGRLGVGESGGGRVYIPRVTMRGEDALPIENALQIAAGRSHSCSRMQDGHVDCWGDNSVGQIAQPAEIGSTPDARRVQGVQGVTALCAGDFHACVVTDGRVVCWGDNSQGQLGRATEDDDRVPGEVPDLTGVESIACGNYFTCAVTDSGVGHCWGMNNSGARGDDREDSTHLPNTLAIEPIRDLAINGSACAARADRAGVWCWGGNWYGQLGHGERSEGRHSSGIAIRSLD